MPPPPDRFDDTIMAPATPRQYGPRAIVRLSGPLAWPAALSCVSAPFTTGISAERRGVAAARLLLLNQTLPAQLWNFPAPRSATGEHCVEIHLPGSPWLIEALLERLRSAGCRDARPGEFTRRAFLNGRMDLAQAEAVMSLISASDAAAARRAFQVLSGGLSREIGGLLEALEILCARFEVSFDFDEEAAAQVDMASFGRTLRELLEECGRLRERALRRLPHQRYQAALVGPANAGKSSLLNRMIGKERLTAADEPGTTRDSVSVLLTFDGIDMDCFDTAGTGADDSSPLARAAGDARDAVARDADLVLLAVETDRSDHAPLLEALSRWLPTAAVAHEKVLVVRTKADTTETPTPLSDALLSYESITTSARTGFGIDELKRAIAGRLRSAFPVESAGISARAALLMEEAYLALTDALEALDTGVPLEVSSALARSALSALRELLGREASTDILDAVFLHFCIGK